MRTSNVARKKTKSAKPEAPKKIEPNIEPQSPQQIVDTEKQITMLLKRGREKGFLTYEEINDNVPDNAVSPSRLDSLLATFDEMGINLFDEADVKLQQLDKSQEEEFEISDESPGGPETETEQQIRKKDKLLEKELVGQDTSRRIDDPIRMYLTQMGQIPLLTRKSEIALARKIEITRMGFRRKMLQCDYCARNSLDLLQQVHAGEMSFDRTVKTSTAVNTTKMVIKKRLPENLKTVDTLLKMNQNLFKKSIDSQSVSNAARRVESSNKPDSTGEK